MTSEEAINSLKIYVNTSWEDGGPGETDLVFEIRTVLKEIERLRAELNDTKNAVKLIIGRSNDLPWPDVLDVDVDGYVKFIRQQCKAVEAAGGNDNG